MVYLFNSSRSLKIFHPIPYSLFCTLHKKFLKTSEDKDVEALARLSAFFFNKIFLPTNELLIEKHNGYLDKSAIPETSFNLDYSCIVPLQTLDMTGELEAVGCTCITVLQ